MLAGKAVKSQRGMGVRKLAMHCRLAATGTHGLCALGAIQRNSRYHGRDTFREIDRLPRKTNISAKFCEIRDFRLISMYFVTFLLRFYTVLAPAALSLPTLCDHTVLPATRQS